MTREFLSLVAHYGQQKFCVAEAFERANNGIRKEVFRRDSGGPDYVTTSAVGQNRDLYLSYGWSEGTWWGSVSHQCVEPERGDRCRVLECEWRAAIADLQRAERAIDRAVAIPPGRLPTTAEVAAAVVALLRSAP